MTTRHLQQNVFSVGTVATPCAESCVLNHIIACLPVANPTHSTGLASVSYCTGRDLYYSFFNWETLQAFWVIPMHWSHT